MCMACMEADGLFRAYLLDNAAARAKLTEEEAAYYGFKRDPGSGDWVDAWADAFAADAIDSGPAAQ